MALYEELEEITIEQLQQGLRERTFTTRDVVSSYPRQYRQAGQERSGPQYDEPITRGVYNVVAQPGTESFCVVIDQ